MIGYLGTGLLTEQSKLVIDETKVKRCVVDDQLRTLDEFEELVGNFAEARLIGQKLVGDAVNGDRALVHFTIRLQIDVVVPPGQAAADDLDTANLDDPVAIGHRHAGGFSIQHYAAHVVSLTYTIGCRLACTTPRLASRSACSLPGWPV